MEQNKYIVINQLKTNGLIIYSSSNKKGILYKIINHLIQRKYFFELWKSKTLHDRRLQIKYKTFQKTQNYK